HPILDTSDRKRVKRSCNDILYETAFMRDWPGWPENALAIGENGGGDRLVLLKVNQRYEPTIYVWLHDTHEMEGIAVAFSDLKRSVWLPVAWVRGAPAGSATLARRCRRINCAPAPRAAGHCARRGCGAATAWPPGSPR